jgi:hypothetical protein
MHRRLPGKLGRFFSGKSPIFFAANRLLYFGGRSEADTCFRPVQIGKQPVHRITPAMPVVFCTRVTIAARPKLIRPMPGV